MCVPACLQRARNSSSKSRQGHSIRVSLSGIPVFFLVWRLFFFQSERAATDTNVQFELFRLYPIQTMYHWGVQVLQDLFDVLLAAWVLPFSQLRGYIQWWGVLLAVLAIGLMFFVFREGENLDHETSQPEMIREGLFLGFFTTIAGLIPIAMVNREVAFPAFSRYSLVSSVGVSIFVSMLLMSLKGRIVRSVAAAGLVLIAMLTHHANSVKHAQEAAVVRAFW